MASAARQYHNYYGQDNAAPRRRDKGPELHELPLVRPRRGSSAQIRTRDRVNLRPREEFSFLPAVGLLAAAFLAVLIVISYSQLDGVYAQTVKVRGQLSQLKQEEQTLQAEYEQVFDKEALQGAVENSGANLEEIQSSQKIYVDLSEPDNVVVYDQHGEGLLGWLQELIEDIRS